MLNAKILFLAILVTTACGPQESQTRQQNGGVSYDAPTDDGSLPKIELAPLASLGLADAPTTADQSAANQELIDLLKQAAGKVKVGVAAGNNVFAAGISYSLRNTNGLQRCVKVQIQQRKAGKILVTDTLIPASQPAGCKVSYQPGLSVATLGILASINGQGLVAGVGIGAVFEKAPYIVGCAAGAIGYATNSGTANGTAGAFCTQILNTTTGETY